MLLLPASIDARSPRGSRTRAPTFGQEKEYSCGAASFRSVVRRHGHRVSERTLRRMLRTTSAYGTHPDDIVATAPRFNLRAEARERLNVPFLARALAAGKDVMVNLQAWSDEPIRSRAAWRRHYNDGHWVVLEAVTPDGKLRFMDPWLARERKRGPNAGRLTLNRQDFLARWHDHFVVKGADRRYVDPPERRRYQRMAIIVEPGRRIGRTTLPNSKPGRRSARR